MEDIVKVGELGGPFEDLTSQLLSDFTVAFVSIPVTGADPELLGTGVLVGVEDARAILTAQHVLEVLPDKGRLGLLLGRTNHVESVDTGGVHYLKIDRGKLDSEGPDLGAVLLAPPVAGSIGGRKSSFSLSLHREAALTSPPDPNDGVWAANGFLQERTKAWIEPDGSRIKGFYNFTALGGATPLPSRGLFDYLDYPVDQEGRAGAPVGWGGMSGSGLWQIQVKR